MNVLIVDDNSEVRRTICDLTADLVDGFFECADGGEAYAMYVTHRPEWILMDIAMKNVDGISATRQIIGAFPKAKIVIVTVFGEDDLRKTAAAAGAREYIVKENLFDLRRLLAK